jgi:hypothetical protein
MRIDSARRRKHHSAQAGRLPRDAFATRQPFAAGERFTSSIAFQNAVETEVNACKLP